MARRMKSKIVVEYGPHAHYGDGKISEHAILPCEETNYRLLQHCVGTTGWDTRWCSWSSTVYLVTLPSRHSGQAGRSDLSWCAFGVERRYESARGCRGSSSLNT